MDQTQPPRRRCTGLLAGALAAGALGVFAVGATANGGDAERTAQPATPAPALVQEEGGARPDGGDRDGRDCPRGADGQSPQGETPDTSVQL